MGYYNRYFFIREGKNFYYENFIEVDKKIIFFSKNKCKKYSDHVDYYLYKECDKFIGLTVDILIIDNLNLLNSNLISILCGTVKSSGKIIFNYKKETLFIQRFIKILSNSNRNENKKNDINRFTEQEKLMKKLSDEFIKNRTGKYYITSSRGCGKTVLIALLINQIGLNFNKIEILANRKILTPFLISEKNIHFLSKNDTFLGDLIFIDEAASLSVPILKKILKNKLVILLSTNETYEGNFNYFSLKILNEYKFKIHTLHTKIRIEDDILNMFNRAILIRDGVLENLKISQLKFINQNKNILFNGTEESEKLLEKIAILFRQSHYKHSLNDLRNYSELSDHFLHCSFDRDNNLAAVLYYKIEKDSGRENLINYKLKIDNKNTLRIIRLSVHPNYKNKNIGSRIIKNLTETIKCDIFAVAFSLSPLLKFWEKNDFCPVYLSKTKNIMSGEFSIFMMKKCNFITSYVENFYIQFFNDISYFYTDLNIDIVESIILNTVFINYEIPFNKYEKNLIDEYLKNEVDFINLISLLQPVALFYFKMKKIFFNKFEQKILILIGLQKKSLKELYEILNCNSSDLSFSMKSIFYQIKSLFFKL